MSSLYNDLDKFLKTDGIRIVMESGCLRSEPPELLTPGDIASFGSMNLESMDRTRLECLLNQLDCLLDTLEESEPEEDDHEAHSLWEEQVSAAESFMDEVQDRLDELEQESAPVIKRLQQIKPIRL